MKKVSTISIWFRKSLLLFAAVLLLVTGGFRGTSIAQTPASVPDSIVLDYEWYDPTPPQSECSEDGSTESLTIPNGNAEKNGREIFNFFVTHGYKPYQAAGIIGNMTVESGLMPQRLQGTPAKKITTAKSFMDRGLSSGWGLVQWTPGSKFIKAVGVERADNLGAQIEFVWAQLEGKAPAPSNLWEKTAGTDLKATSNIKEAVLAFQGNKSAGGKYFGFERPKDQSGSVNARLSYAKAALAKYGSDAPSTTNADTTDESVAVCNDADPGEQASIGRINKDDLFKDSTGIACAPGTKDLGIQDGWYKGKKFPIRICAIPGFPSTSEESHDGYGVKGAGGNVVVNSRVSANVSQMVKDAKKSGVNLAAISSFRTYSHQQDLCPCDGVRKARPGYSNHQSGLAIDFKNVSGFIAGASCAGRARDTSDATWQWLNKNAARYGFGQYPAEAWHWDATQTCGGSGV